jgi:hypothetical protein
MKKYLVIIVCFFLFTILHLSCKKKMKIDEARVEIERYLDKEFRNSFNIDSIAKDYNPDMFHEQWGYKVWLIDTSKIVFGPVFIEDNEVQGWIVYKGSDIAKEYQKAKSGK